MSVGKATKQARLCIHYGARSYRRYVVVVVVVDVDVTVVVVLVVVKGIRESLAVSALVILCG